MTYFVCGNRIGHFFDRKGENMPSQENLKNKQEVIDEISGKIEKASSVVVIDYIGISVDQANAMRVKLRDAGVDYKVYKNTLVKRAIDGTPNESLAAILEGPSAFAFGYEDATAPARVLDGIIKEYKKMEFKAGLVDGVFYDAEGIKQIASIPSREVLIARFMGSIQSPIGKLVRTFAAIADANGEPAPAAEAAPADAAETVAEAPAEEAVEAAAMETVEEAAPADAAETVAEAPAEEAVEAAAMETVEEAAPAEEAEEAASAEEAEEAAAAPETEETVSEE